MFRHYSPPETNKYDTLKQRILERFSVSDQKRLQTLLSGMQIGDDKPSHFLQRMRREVPSKFDNMNDIIKHLWIQQLPVNVQSCLAQTDEEDLDKLGKLADKVFEVTEPSVSGIESSSVLSSITELQAQRFINEVIRGLDFAYAFLDDILVASISPTEHEQHLRLLLQRFQDYGIVINADKCVFGKSEIEFLGYSVSAQGTRPLASKVQAVVDYPQPKNKSELRRFLAMLNFYRRFLRNTAATQASLHNYMKDSKKADKTPIVWTAETTTAFLKCKEDLANAALLAHPSSSLPLALMVDASDSAIGAVLQQSKNGKWQPLGFYSKKLSPAQRNYSTYDRELLAAYAAVKYFRYMIEGRSFTLYTDHKPLTFAFNRKSSSDTPRQARYLDFTTQFITDIQHISGSSNVTADSLSLASLPSACQIHWIMIDWHLSNGPVRN
uniref:RNA-directed DNA polymerase n=1 Tax=Trichuris muris TaxID=70415 RepID=A0A5S6QGU7_TRIMR